MSFQSHVKSWEQNEIFTKKIVLVQKTDFKNSDNAENQLKESPLCLVSNVINYV